MAVNFTLSYNNNNNYKDLFFQLNTAAIGMEGQFTISTVNVNIPTTQDTIQTIDLSLTASQENSMFRIYRSSDDADYIKNFSTISQAQITNGQLILTRLGNMPTAAIDVVLVFFE